MSAAPVVEESSDEGSFADEPLPARRSDVVEVEAAQVQRNPAVLTNFVSEPTCVGVTVEEVTDNSPTVVPSHNCIVNEPASDSDSDFAANGDRLLPIVEQDDGARSSQLERTKSYPLSSFADDYALQEKVGQGTGGVVYRAQARHGDQDIVAVKIIDVRKWALAGLEPTRVMQEVEVMRRTCHPQVVKLRALYRNDEEWYIVMDFMQGIELYDFILQSGALDEGSALLVFVQIASALLYLHEEMHIVHRDVKPENVMILDELSPEGKLQARLLDFGLSKILSTSNSGKSFVGTAGYVAPEVLEVRASAIGADCHTEQSYGFPVDMYSLGATLYVMVTATACRPRFIEGKTCFDGEEWEELSTEVKELIVALMSPIPSERPDARAALSHPWVLSGEKSNKCVVSVASENSAVDAELDKDSGDKAYPPKVAKKGSRELDVGLSRQRTEISGSTERSQNEGFTYGVLPLKKLGAIHEDLTRAAHRAQEAALSTGCESLIAVVQEILVLCRDQIHHSLIVLRSVRGTASDAIQVLDDAEIALKEGDNKLVHVFFSSMTRWAGALRTETAATQMQLRKGIHDLGELRCRMSCAEQPTTTEGSMSLKRAPSVKLRSPAGDTLHHDPLRLLVAEAETMLGHAETDDVLRPPADQGHRKDAVVVEAKATDSVPLTEKQVGVSAAMSAVQELHTYLHQVDYVFESACTFWADAEALLASQLRRGEHVESIITAASTSPAMRERLQERMQQLRSFWSRARDYADAFQAAMESRRPLNFNDFSAG